MSERDRYRCSFDAVAETYERGRPGYAPQAVEWIAERLPFADVLDLAAGTGKLTRQLVALGAHVVAVEPGDGMRAVLERVVPEATALAGSAEAIPLPDASVDAITVGQAFHWFRHEEALAEMHRVLRPGGGIALLWNIWNEDDPIQRGLDELIDGSRAQFWAKRPPTRDRLAASRFFGPAEERTFTRPFPTTPDAVVEWVASTSPVATAAPDERARIEAEVRALIPSVPFELALDTTVLLAPRLS